MISKITIFFMMVLLLGILSLGFADTFYDESQILRAFIFVFLFAGFFFIWLIVSAAFLSLNSDIQFKVAELSDIEATLKLHAQYQVDSINEEDKKDGFVTTAFTKEELTELILKENGLFIAYKGDEVLAYVMAASWDFWSRWPMFAFMIEDLENLEYLGQTLTIENSYQYGPICIDKSVRGSGMLEDIFEFSRNHMARRFPILVTFVNKINPRSFAAHTKKLKLEVIQEFTFNGNFYDEMVYDTSKKVAKDV